MTSHDQPRFDRRSTVQRDMKGTCWLFPISPPSLITTMPSSLDNDPSVAQRDTVRHRRRRRGADPLWQELSEAEKEEARRAVLGVAEQRWKSAINPTPGKLLETSSVYSIEEQSTSSSTSRSAEKPSERAVSRGSRRGRRERNDNEAINNTPAPSRALTSSSSKNSSHTNNTQSLTFQVHQNPPLWRRFLRATPQPHYYYPPSNADAWMCGVCGKAFTSYEAADTHEDAHIRHVVLHQLPWLKTAPASGTNNNNNHNPPGILRHSSSMEQTDTTNQPTTPVVSNRQLLPQRRLLTADDRGEEAKVPEDELFHREVPTTPTRRRRSVSYTDVPLRIDPLLGQPEPDEALLLSPTLQESALLADEALVQVCHKATPMILSAAECDAEWELQCLARDKAYYDALAERERARRTKPGDKYRSDETDGWWGAVQNKFLDAYQIMKGSGGKGFKDEYRARQWNSSVNAMQHTEKTLYLNVIVKNNIRVVRQELERLARERWERKEEPLHAKRFERFRALAQANMIRLAALALKSDFTPRRVAEQLSNDFHRLLTPRLRRRGVKIETAIEYRIGPYFVIAINITQINWGRLVQATFKEVTRRKQKWKEEEDNDEVDGEAEDKEVATWRERVQEWPFIRYCTECFVQIRRLTRFELIAQLLAWCHHLHWVLYQPILIALYATFLGHAIRQFILSSVADEIFYHIEQKGMEMEMEIREASLQAAFMLSALREIRADGQELRKKQQQTKLQEKGATLGPLLGPAIKEDKESVEIPDGFELPENLEYLGLELELPGVGFRRLRWALLHKDSSFVSEAVYRSEAKYENITMGTWNKCTDYIGAPSLPPDVDESEFIGAERKSSYLMPSSAFVKANMCSETQYILAYNDYCFCFRKKALTPDAPFGSTFVAWTQFLVVNNGNDSCKLYCSVEPEFPNGPPLVSQQIKSGMRAGVSELFVLFGETISKYATEFP